MTTARPATITRPPDADAGRSSPGGTAAGVSAIGASAVDRRGGDSPTQRQTFGLEELAVVLSHYDLGELTEICEFPRGSRKAPKLIVGTPEQFYLLKRRARGRDDPHKVAFCHGIQTHLAERQFPLPRLIGTRRDGNSMLVHAGRTYELFEFIQGTSYDGSLGATTEAGRTLALFHKLLADHEPVYQPSRGSYHGSRSVMASTNAIPTTLQRTDPGLDRGAIGRTVQFLAESYRDATDRVNDAGLNRWPLSIAHSDWHPGNALFRGPRVVAVIDYDAARMQPRIVDAANGALQFSMIGGDAAAPEDWPDYLDESRFRRFVRGYDEVPDAVLSRAELRVTPWLMIEALIAESVIPIASHGVFGKVAGGRFLPMVQRKVRWLQEHADRLVASVEE
ncbi:MAG: phosphotransferase [Planctomycetota bacterium]